MAMPVIGLSADQVETSLKAVAILLAKAAQIPDDKTRADAIEEAHAIFDSIAWDFNKTAIDDDGEVANYDFFEWRKLQHWESVPSASREESPLVQMLQGALPILTQFAAQMVQARQEQQQARNRAYADDYDVWDPPYEPVNDEVRREQLVKAISDIKLAREAGLDKLADELENMAVSRYGLGSFMQPVRPVVRPVPTCTSCDGEEKPGVVFNLDDMLAGRGAPAPVTKHYDGFKITHRPDGISRAERTGPIRDPEQPRVVPPQPRRMPRGTPRAVSRSETVAPFDDSKTVVKDPDQALLGLLDRVRGLARQYETQPHSGLPPEQVAVSLFGAIEQIRAYKVPVPDEFKPVVENFHDTSTHEAAVSVLLPESAGISTDYRAAVVKHLAQLKA